MAHKKSLIIGGLLGAAILSWILAFAQYAYNTLGSDSLTNDLWILGAILAVATVIVAGVIDRD